MTLRLAWLPTAILVVLLAACTGLPMVTPVAPANATSPLATPAGVSGASMVYDDPYAYCAAVGTIDEPDERYVGPAAPESIARDLRAVLNTPNTPLEVYQQGLFWRCMDGRVYACMVGANLPCWAKADLSQEPTPAMNDFCAENPDAEGIPAVVTGRETVYTWRCEGTTAVVDSQIGEVDERGYLTNIWYALPAE
ncbi:MAG TPA: hypothetical protein VNK95_17390 [Caldilineaceae bacterium]|nr:hypothetical protein [Caldilineaceae bacterium]